MKKRIRHPGLLWGICFLLAISLSACLPGRAPVRDQLVGTWENTDGYRIIFYEDGSGLFPGGEQLPDVPFRYEVVEGDQLVIDLPENQFQIEIDLEGDTLIWTDQLGMVRYERVVP